MLFIEPSFEKLNAEAFGNPVVRKLSTVNVLALTAFGLSMVILRDVFELDFLLMNTVAVTVAWFSFGWISTKNYFTVWRLNSMSLVSCGFLTLLCSNQYICDHHSWIVSFSTFFFTAHVHLTNATISSIELPEKTRRSHEHIKLHRLLVLIFVFYIGSFLTVRDGNHVTFLFGILIVLTGVRLEMIPAEVQKERSKAKME
ncbi:Cytochrome b561 domain-containing protein [Caenorhabditis elegans]|uniref:Cytochrome b561 domain-containing protein n=1 Tax=Caenorhabditis elegans TaxID=6239 RepID=Q9XUL2_CAEEL|nr:Cytochrome b561 domain-containing protein [Caenorhabditis elegans]CAB04914.1 Cytochrome b561 domain-containing protein [Caenorhabditis elegans]|eukprot:NP_507825.1 Uncharacterized protein CELE_W04E12.2 [Caenorhabditis elegans]